MTYLKNILFISFVSLALIGCGEDQKKKSKSEAPSEQHETVDENPEKSKDESDEDRESYFPFPKKWLDTSGTVTLPDADDRNSFNLYYHPIKDKKGILQTFQHGCELDFDLRDNCFEWGRRYEYVAIASVKTDIDWKQFILKDGKISIVDPQYRALSNVWLDSLNRRLYDPLLLKPDTSCATVKKGRIYFLRFWNKGRQESIFFRLLVTELKEHKSVTFDWQRLQEFDGKLEPTPDFLKHSIKSLLKLGYGGETKLTTEPHRNDFSFKHDRYGHYVKNNEVYRLNHDITFYPHRSQLELARVGGRHNYWVMLNQWSDFDDIVLTDQGFTSFKAPQTEPADLKRANKVLFSDKPRAPLPNMDYITGLEAKKIILIRSTLSREEDVFVKLTVVSYTPRSDTEPGSIVLRWERLYPMSASLLLELTGERERSHE